MNESNTRNRRKILFFILSGIGGAERVMITIAKMLPLDRFEVKFVVVAKTKGTIAKHIPEGYPIEYLLLPNIWCFGTSRIYRVLKRERPDVAFSSAMYMNCRVALCAHMLGIKSIIRNCNYMCIQRWDKKYLIRKTYPFADVVISQQEEMVEDIVNEVGIDREKVICMHNPIDTDIIDAKKDAPSPYPTSDAINYVWVARFHNQKGQDILAKAFVEVARNNPKAHLWYVGRYSESSTLYQTVRDTLEQGNCLDRTHFVGFDENPYRWVKHSDCFVLPSRIEGLPNALVEAQYLGRPCVATRCIPIVDRIIENGVNGYTVPSEDYHALAEAMLKTPQLGEIKMTYKPTDKRDFIALFE